MPPDKSVMALSFVLSLAAVAACSSEADVVPPAPETAPLEGTTDALPSEVSPPSVYVAKVKNVLVGLPPTDEEVKAVTADPAKLGTLIDGWMQLPQYRAKMLRFFQLAFQQTQVDEADFTEQTFPNQFWQNRATSSVLVQNATESFARTVLELTAHGRPLTDALTTRKLMMTPALMELYAYLDAWQVNDDGKVTDRFKLAHPTTSLVVTSTAPIPIEESVNPASPNFMHWYNPDLAKYDATDPGCYTDPVVFEKGANSTTGAALQRILQGGLQGRKVGSPARACQPVAGGSAIVLSEEDFTTWKMVTIRQPKAGERATDFFDIPKLRAATELVLQVPRVGFFSTPAFFANWHTNTSNQMRVTMNQALIVALGAAVDGTDGTHPTSTPGLDGAHAGDPACVSCHQTLDPTRSVFAASFSWNYHNQTETSFASQPGMFAFQGVIKPVASLDEFGGTLGSHPLFANAWAQKLCYYANSRKCDASDPEFLRVVDAFKASGFSWDALVRDLLSSPITTNAKPTKTVSDTGEVIAVSRRDHLCASLDARLGLQDVCGLITAPTKRQAALSNVNIIASGLPSDGYGRGAIAPVLPNEPSLFYRAGAENICASVAQLVIDVKAPTPNARQWSSAQPDPAIADFVQLLVALTASDARSAPSIAALRLHFDSAVKTGASASDALKSTFVVACLAPSSISIGL